MSIERSLSVLAGIFVMSSALLSIYHSPEWIWLTIFIGFNLIQSAFTGFCPPAWVMRKMGKKSEAELALSKPK